MRHVATPRGREAHAESELGVTGAGKPGSSRRGPTSRASEVQVQKERLFRTRGRVHGATSPAATREDDHRGRTSPGRPQLSRSNTPPGSGLKGVTSCTEAAGWTPLGGPCGPHTTRTKQETGALRAGGPPAETVTAPATCRTHRPALPCPSDGGRLARPHVGKGRVRVAAQGQADRPRLPGAMRPCTPPRRAAWWGPLSVTGCKSQAM